MPKVESCSNEIPEFYSNSASFGFETEKLIHNSQNLFIVARLWLFVLSRFHNLILGLRFFSLSFLRGLSNLISWGFCVFIKCGKFVCACLFGSGIQKHRWHWTWLTLFMGDRFQILFFPPILFYELSIWPAACIAYLNPRLFTYQHRSPQLLDMLFPLSLSLSILLPGSNLLSHL